MFGTPKYRLISDCEIASSKGGDLGERSLKYEDSSLQSCDKDILYNCRGQDRKKAS